MALNATQESCLFCGEANPLPGTVDQAKKEQKPSKVAPEASSPRPLHATSTPGTPTITSQHPPRVDDSRGQLKHGASQKRDPICPRCGKDNALIANSRFCFSCGATLLPEKQPTTDTQVQVPPRHCPHCGKDISKNPKGGKFCLYCGKAIASPGSQQAATQPAPPALEARVANVKPSTPTPSRRASQAAGQPHAIPPRVSHAQEEQVDMLNISCRYDAPVLSASFSRDGGTFFVGTARNEIIERVVTNARSRTTILGDPSGMAITMLIEPGSTGFATCMRGDVMRFRRVAIRDHDVGNFTCQVRTTQSAILSIAASPAVSKLLLGGYDHVAEIWDMKDGKLLYTLADHAGAIDATTFDSTGKLGATGGRDGAVIVWKTESGDMLRKFFAHAKPVSSLAFSNDSSRLASGSEDGSIKIWDPERNSPLTTLVGHRGGVLALAFDRDGKRLVSGGRDTIARVWDLASGKEIRSIERHVGAITAISISPDGKRVVTGGADKRSYHWSLDEVKK